MTDVRYDPMTGRPIVPPPAPPVAPAKAARKLPPAKELTKEERVDALIAGYELGLEHNSPRTHAELDELRFALGKELKVTPLTDEERKALVEAGPKVPKDTMLTDKGDVVSGAVATASVPADVAAKHHNLRGLRYFVAGDKVVLVNDARTVVTDEAVKAI